jgi:hypothetical protein
MVMFLSWNTSPRWPQSCHSTGCVAAVEAAGASGLLSTVTVTRSGSAATMLEETASEHAWRSFMAGMYRRRDESRVRKSLLLVGPIRTTGKQEIMYTEPGAPEIVSNRA